MKSFTKVFFLLLILISVNISAQECNGNTFNSPGAPATCTYNYTASGWEDQFGNPITAPSSINVGESVCFLQIILLILVKLKVFFTLPWELHILEV